MERDMMGKLLLISLNQKLDITLVLQYPLTPVPLVFSHLDEAVNTTDKAVLYKNLEKRINSVGPGHIDVYIVDRFFFTPARSKHTTKLWKYRKIYPGKAL